MSNHFNDEAFLARLRQDPSHMWRPVELVDHAATHGTPSFPPGHGFAHSDAGYVITGILVEQVTGRPLHTVYRELIAAELLRIRDGHGTNPSSEAAAAPTRSQPDRGSP